RGALHLGGGLMTGLRYIRWISVGATVAAVSLASGPGAALAGAGGSDSAARATARATHAAAHGSAGGAGVGQPSADFNGDGYPDIAVGTIFENIGSSDLNAGAVNVMYGSAAGLQATGTGGPDDQFWYQG